LERLLEVDVYTCTEHAVVTGETSFIRQFVSAYILGLVTVESRVEGVEVGHVEIDFLAQMYAGTYTHRV